MFSKIKTIHSHIIPNPERIVKILDNFALVLYGLFIFEAFLRSTTMVIDWPTKYHFVLKVFLLLLVITKSFVKVFDDIASYVLLFLCALGYTVAYIQGYHGILLEIILFIVLFKDIDFKKVAIVFLGTIGTSLLIIMLSSQLGIVNNLTFISEGNSQRYSFGVNYPTDFSALVLYLCMVWAFIRREYISYIEICLFYGLAFFILFMCVARTSTICLVILATFLLIYKLIMAKKNEDTPTKKSTRVISLLMTFAIPVCGAFSIFSSYLFKPDKVLFSKLDSIFSGRLSLGRTTFDHYDVKLFGQEIPLVGNGGSTLSRGKDAYNFIDSSYLNILFRYGAFVLICTVLLLFITSIVARQRKDYVSLFIIALIAVHCIMEHHLLDLQFDPFIFLLFSSYYGFNISNFFKRKNIDKEVAQ
ncbi:MAG: hypothetical protein E7258_00025 [Lachnospiraceae bacterium]|nr:hypothetical protein [Lachnospiraceae bacterium]